MKTKRIPQLQYWRALTIAGSDSGGGAGIQADLKTFGVLGCYGCSVITAITAQNTVSVDRVHPLPGEIVLAQIKSVVDDIGVDVIKIGMLHTPEIIHAVVEGIAPLVEKKVPIVVDTVMMAKNGEKLLQPQAVEALVSYIFPLTDLTTPNLPEAERLLGRSIRSPDEMEQAAFDLSLLGPKAVVLKGGHLEEDMSNDCLYISDGPEKGHHWFHARRVLTANVHGTGCTYSAAIAAYLAQGVSLTTSVSQAKDYLTRAIRAGSQVSIGAGHGPVHHFHPYWEPTLRYPAAIAC